MYQVVKDTKQYFKKQTKKSRPDNFVFRLHYKTTFGILALSSILVSCYEYIDTDGAAIQCVVDQNAGVSQKMVNTYCWFSSTFTLPRYWEGRTGEDILHFGVGPSLEQDKKVHQAYYQWVPLMLAMQAIMFYLPHYVWKMMEGGRMEHIISDLDKELAKDKETKIDNLAAYMKQRMKYPHEHQVWSATFLFCEFLNLLNVISQIFLTNKFLGGSFYNYGLEVITWSSLDPEDRVDPMSKIFPRVTKCDFHMFGPSGTIQNYDALCVLGMNILNEKIFIFLWFWFFVLAAVTAVSLMTRVCQLMVPSIRRRLIMLEETGFRPRGPRSGDTERVLAVLSIPDWMILYHMAQCMDRRHFSKLIARMAVEDGGKVYSDNKDIKNGELSHSPGQSNSKV